MRVLLVCLLAILGSALAYKSYDGYQVIETEKLDLNLVRRFAPLIHNEKLDFWTPPRVGGQAKIMVAPQYASSLRFALASMGVRTKIVIPDVEIILQKERAELEALRATEKREGRAPDLTRFLNYDEIQAYLDEVAAAFPSIATLIPIGTSYEGRPMRILKLSNGPGKTGIVFDAAIHAREWIGPPTVLFTINELTENLANNQAILDAHDFYFLPVTNPDGYSYTFTDDRLWRKTRSPNAGSICVGTDPNRNFDQNWAGGGQGTPCSDTYPGSAPFSEPETKALSDFIAATQSITFGLSVHSCGQYLLYPYGDTTALPPNVVELERVGSEALTALASINGTPYQLGSIANVLYFAYGSTTDWNYVKQGLTLSYTIELPCGGNDGFDPPPSAIPTVNAETWEAYKVFAANIPAARG